jgi:predicted transcriptional regulator
MDALPTGLRVLTTAHMRKKTAVISIRVLPQLKEALEQLAKADRRPLASYLELLLEQHVDATRAREKVKPTKAKTGPAKS